MNSLDDDPKVAAVLARLHSEAEAQTPELREKAGRIRKNGMMPDDWAEQLRGYFLAVSRDQGRFLYQTVRCVAAKRIVEFGTSFGVSSIYLAAGLRDNGGGLLVGSEFLEDKAATARANIAEAGLAEYAEIRPGDARTSLADPGGTIDMLLLGGGPALYVEIVQLLVPHLRPCAAVLADNIEAGGEGEQPYAKWVRDPANGFMSSSIMMKGGTEYSVWLGAS
jgi:predicted O-methyltransferase YrrM